MTSLFQKSPVTPRKLNKPSGEDPTSPTPKGESQPQMMGSGSDPVSGLTGAASGAAEQATDTVGDATKTAQDANPLSGGGEGEQSGSGLGQVGEQAQNLPQTAEGVADQAKDAVSNLASLEGLPVSDGGLIKDKAGQTVGKVVEGDAENLVGYSPNSNGEILDGDGDPVGRVELTDQVTDQANAAVSSLASLDGVPVTDGGVIKDKSGQTIGKVVEGDAENLVGYTPNDKGEILDGDGDPVGRVDLTSEVKEAAPELKDAEGTVDDAKSTAQETTPEVKDAEGTVDDAKSTAQETAPENLQEVEPTAEQAADGVQENVENLPPLSTLENLKCNKLGKIVGADGKPVGELVEGDPKKLASMGATLDAEGQFWDTRGNVIGKARTLPPEDYGDEPPFAGLEGLHVVEGGWVEDDRGKRVGQIVEGDPKKVLGRPVDEDGEITDKHGSTIARAEYWEQPDEPEPEPVDLSDLNGLTCNKTGYVIGPNGVPVARVVEGIPTELAGMTIEDGQFWDGRKPVGRVELIPENEREKKPEGPFAGLDNPVVNKDGFVEDADGNIVGQVTEGDIKNLRGRTVDDDGDIVDKFGTTKGHAEPYEPPEEEKADLSSLEGKVVNKSGNVVDAQGNVFGRVVSGSGKDLAGRKVDGLGQVWGDDGKVIGKAELIPGADQQKPEGAFFGFPDAKVAGDGVVVSGDKIIGRVVEGDPKRLEGRQVDEDGEILDKTGNTIGRAERWEPEQKQRRVNPMSGRKVTRDGEVRDADGNLIGKLTSGNLGTLVGMEIDDNGYVVDNDGNKVGECTLLENIKEPEEEGPSPEELEKQKKDEEDRALAKKMSSIVGQTLEQVRPICSMITEVCFLSENTRAPLTCTSTSKKLSVHPRRNWTRRN